jgi:hypothetical protein
MSRAISGLNALSGRGGLYSAGLFEGDAKGDAGAAARIVLHFERAGMVFHDLLNDGQT